MLQYLVCLFPPDSPLLYQLLNAKNKSGNTALHWAALNGHLEAVRVLLGAGANPAVINNAGHDAVYEAEVNEHGKVAEWILTEGKGLEQAAGRGREDDKENIEGKDEGVTLGPEDVVGVVEDRLESMGMHDDP